MFVADPHLDLILRSFLLTAAALAWVVLGVRMVGLRSFSKMTSFDFVVTVAIGSLLAGASQCTQWEAFTQVLLAMLALLGMQVVIAVLRKKFRGVQVLVQNEPVLLMRDGVIFEQALAATRVAKDDLIAKLREANACEMSQVRAVVLETTGDISVLHGDSLDETVLLGVRSV